MAENRSELLYLQKKKVLLQQCLEKTEELLSCLTSEKADDLPKAISRLITERGEIIHEVESLESSLGTNLNRNTFLNQNTSHDPSDSDKEKKEINRLINLLLTLDKDAAQLIKSFQDKLMVDLREHAQIQKIIPYASSSIPQRGRLMDYKK